MTVVSLRGLHTTLGVSAVTSGVVMVEYWAGSGPVARVDGADVVFPALITAAIVDGDPGTLDLMPTRGVCCVKWTVQSDQSPVPVVRYTEIPATGPVAFGALQQVDPATFVPTGDVVAAWEAAIDDVTALRDQAAGSASAAAGSAATASAAATGAAGSASTASGAASAAGGSASAAAGSASTASTGAATATSKATAASSSADAAAGSATAAAGSASAAAGSATAAGQSKTDADTARAAAQAAQTGAEVARDVALAGQFAGAALGAADLNTVTVPGVYRQDVGANATLANNYPVVNVVGVLEVHRRGTGPSEVIQRFSFASGAGSSHGIYMRRWNGSWSAWVFLASQRVDQTAGRAIYTWDDVNGREQLVWGDTGWRDVTSLLLNGWTATSGHLNIRRIGSIVYARFGNVSSAAATGSTLYTLPSGFGVGQWQAFDIPSYAAANQKLVVDNYDMKPPAFTQSIVYSAGGRYAVISWPANDSWPTSLPGTANGAIPNT